MRKFYLICENGTAKGDSSKYGTNNEMLPLSTGVEINSEF
jgi:hypothetical protein